MDKDKIFEIFFKTIQESTEWGLGCDGKNYGHWIDGVVAITENLLAEVNKTRNYDAETQQLNN